MKKFIILFLVPVAGLLSLKTVDDYFEVSKNLDIFASVYKEVNTAYVDEVKPGELIRVAIDAMLASLDPYTNFYSEAQAEDYMYQVTGTYAGIGTSIKYRDNKIIINEPHEGFPAQKAGLLPGDIVLEIDGVPMEGKSQKEVIEFMQGNAGTSILMKIERPGKGEMDFKVTRDKIKLPNVPYAGLVNENTGYIKLTGFTPGAGKEVHDAVQQLKNQGAKSLILDLRGNGGGLLHEAINIVNIFVKKGQIIVTTRGRSREEDQVYKTLNSPVDTEIPLAILIDGGSASASEIVAGALQDLDRAVLIGRNSYGKGLVQSTKRLSYNTQMKMTIAKYYIPSGRLIQRLDYLHKVDGRAIAVADSLKHTFYTKNGRPVTDGEGVFPDLEVELNEESKLSQSLVRNNHLFDYATLYRNRTSSIAPAISFDISDELFKDFTEYLSNKEYEYTTNTEKLVAKLITEAESEQYSDTLVREIHRLEEQLKMLKKNDLLRYREELSEILEYEIARRYYFERGSIEVSFDDDPDIAKAMEVLADKSKHASLLGY